jgi:hypothetical protein
MEKKRWNIPKKAEYLDRTLKDGMQKAWIEHRK